MTSAVVEAQPEQVTELQLPVDVEIRTLRPHPDDRGYLVELFRPDWDVPVRPIQWNLTMAREGVLRGPQFHLHRMEYLILLEGRMSAGLATSREAAHRRSLRACRGGGFPGGPSPDHDRRGRGVPRVLLPRGLEGAPRRADDLGQA